MKEGKLSNWYDGLCWPESCPYKHFLLTSFTAGAFIFPPKASLVVRNGPATTLMDLMGPKCAQKCTERTLMNLKRVQVDPRGMVCTRERVVSSNLAHVVHMVPFCRNDVEFCID